MLFKIAAIVKLVFSVSVQLKQHIKLVQEKKESYIITMK